MSNSFALEDYFAKAKKYEVPRRELSIIAGPEGFYPQKFTVFVGELVKFYVTSTTETPSCFILNDKKLFLGARKGKIAEGEAYFNKTGTHKFYCPTGKISGRITVIERPDHKRERIRRETASQKMIKIWRPRDE
jgi:plastocyanin